MSSPEFDLLVLGASMTGVELIHQLRRTSAGRKLKICVVDRLAAHTYIPLCHEWLTGRVDPAEGTLQTKAYVESGGRATYRVGEIVGVDLDAMAVELEGGETLRARAAVVALGSTIGVPDGVGGREKFRTLKFGPEIERAQADLARVLGEDGPADPRVLVVGGGITGVELAGELAWLRAHPNGAQTGGGSAGSRPFEITLVHGGERLLPALCPRAGERAAEALEKQGVDLRLNTRLVEHEGEGVLLRDGTSGKAETLRLECHLAYWGGGLRPAPLLAQIGLPRTENGWLAVSPSLQCFPMGDGPAGWFAGGDAVRIQGGDGEWNTMQRAIECIWQAKVLARNLLAFLGVADDEDPVFVPHRLREEFPHGVSVGAHSLVVWGPLVVDRPGINTWFRRWLMAQYMARYAP